MSVCELIKILLPRFSIIVASIPLRLIHLNWISPIVVIVLHRMLILLIIYAFTLRGYHSRIFFFFQAAETFVITSISIISIITINLH